MLRHHRLSEALARLRNRRHDKIGGVQARAQAVDRALIEAVLARADPLTARAEVRRDLRRMMRRFRIDPALIPKRFVRDLEAAEKRCAACTAIGRCQHFLLAGATDDPRAFCPNAKLYDQIAASEEPVGV